MISIGTIDANDQLLEVELDGETFFLRLTWNSEASFWVLEVQNYNREAVLSGITVVPNVLLLRRYHYLAVPAGELMALVLSDPAQIGRRSFVDGAARLAYMQAAEVAAVTGGRG